MINYIISACIIVLTIIILYFINNSFKTTSKKVKEPLKVNIMSDHIVILSRDSCPFCISLKEQIKDKNKKYTVVTLTDSQTFNFDDEFTNLSSEERDNILNELEKIFNNGPIFLPTIIKKTKMHVGLPEPEKLEEIFK